MGAGQILTICSARNARRARSKTRELDEGGNPARPPGKYFKRRHNEAHAAVRPEPSPAVLRITCTAGIPEVSRFSCLKFLGVPGVFDYAGLNKSSRYRACSCCLPRITRASASGLHLFGAEYPPHLSSVYASLCPSR